MPIATSTNDAVNAQQHEKHSRFGGAEDWEVCFSSCMSLHQLDRQLQRRKQHGANAAAQRSLCRHLSDETAAPLQSSCRLGARRWLPVFERFLRVKHVLRCTIGTNITPRLHTARSTSSCCRCWQRKRVQDPGK